MIIFDSQAAIAFSTMYKMFLARVPVCKTNTFGRKVRRRREKIETRAKITVSDVKNMENIAQFTKNVYKKDLVKSVKSPPSFWDLGNKGGGLLIGRRPIFF